MVASRSHHISAGLAQRYVKARRFTQFSVFWQPWVRSRWSRREFSAEMLCSPFFNYEIALSAIESRTRAAKIESEKSRRVVVPIVSKLFSLASRREISCDSTHKTLTFRCASSLTSSSTVDKHHSRFPFRLFITFSQPFSMSLRPVSTSLIVSLSRWLLSPRETTSLGHIERRRFFGTGRSRGEGEETIKGNGCVVLSTAEHH